MAIIIDEATRVCVQGITGSAGRAGARLMIDSGTKVVAGVATGNTHSGDGHDPRDVCGVPVFSAVTDAMEHSRQNAGGSVDVSVVFAPAAHVTVAACEAFDAGIKHVVLVADRVPVWDAMRIAELAGACGASFIGPNTLGVLSPGRAVAGVIGGAATLARELFRRGNVGVVGRSGGLVASCGYALGQAGIGISTMVHVGGDPVIGLRIPDVALMFERDQQTEAIVVVGGIGGSQEEGLAGLVLDGRVAKPIVAFVADGVASAGGRNILTDSIGGGDRDAAEAKIRSLREAGVTDVERFDDLPAATLQTLIKAGAVR